MRARSLLAFLGCAIVPALGLAEPFEPRFEAISEDRSDPDVTISWCPASGAPSYDVTIERRASVGDAWDELDTVVSPSCSFADDGENGKTYSYRLTASSPASPGEAVLGTAPEQPINDRRPAMVAAINTTPGIYKNARYQRPHIPSHATSGDGRIAIAMGAQGSGVSAAKHIYLFVPERLDGPFDQSDPADYPVMALRGGGTLPVCTHTTTAEDEPLGCAIPLNQLYAASGTWLEPANIRHTMSTVCDPTHGTPHGQPKNPYPCSANGNYGGPYDCYSLTLLNFMIEPGRNLSELWATKVRVSVSNPKTPQAQIHNVVVTGAPAKGLTLPSVQVAEPMVTDDGRLFVARGPGEFHWNSGSGPQQFGGTAGVDLFYSFYEGGAPCDVTKWHAKTVWKPDEMSEAAACTAGFSGPAQYPGPGRFRGCLDAANTVYPITHAPYHTAVSSRYGFAKYPFVDGEGNPIPDGRNSYLTYPWIDRGGRNLFFTHEGTMLHYVHPNAGTAAIRLRYPAKCPPDPADPENEIECNVSAALAEPPAALEEQSNGQPLGSTMAKYEFFGVRGVGVMGLWTHGKAVFLDNNLNHVDFGPGANETVHRSIELYQDAPGSPDDAWIHIGSGRENTGELPVWASYNSGFIQSLENLWNGLAHVSPRTPREVVWRMSTGVSSDEVVFDDYLDKGMLIFSDMRASFRRSTPHDGSIDQNNAVGNWIYEDGFRSTRPEHDFRRVLHGEGFLDAPRLANSATSPLLALPPFGELKGGMTRIEPIAMGGVVGRGLWLNGASHAEYVLPSAAQYAGSWLVGAFVDPRPAASDAGQARRLLEFPNGDAIDLIAERSASGASLETIRLTAGEDVEDVAVPHVPSEPEGYEWTHLAFAIDAAGDSVRVFVNGFSVAEVAFEAGGAFEIAPGVLRLGNGDGHDHGFIGWLDEFRVQKMDAFDPAQICRFARGRLSRVGAGSDWQPVASSYGAAGANGHGYVDGFDEAAANAQYVCFHDLSTPDALPVDEPADHALTDIGHELLFPEGPLFPYEPRPLGSEDNEFCLSCHDMSFYGGLGLDAFDESPLWTLLDPRRQPFQPPARLYGNIPAGLYGENRPIQATAAPPDGCPSDALVLAESAGTGWCRPACSDNLDNDGDGYIDHDGGSIDEPAAGDPTCAGDPNWSSELQVHSCGLGFELIFVVPPLLWLRRRRLPRS